MPGQFWEALLNAPAPGVGAAYNTSVTLTDVSPAPQYTLPANFLTIGSALRMTATGTFSNITAAPTLLMGFYYGGAASGVKLAATPATTTTLTAASWPWRIEATMIVRTVGTSGTAVCAGVFYLGTSLTTFQLVALDASAQTTATIDTTLAKTLTLGAQWGTSSASNTLTCNQFLVESVA